MKVIDYYNCDRPEHWLCQIKKSDWGAGQYLYRLLSENKRFVYTFPEYRGRRCMGKLFLEIEKLAKAEKAHDIFISTNHNGLYEKYGCEFYQIMEDMNGEPSRVYKKHVD